MKMDYKIFDIYGVDQKFKLNNRLRDFNLIKKGDMIGKVGSNAVRASSSFYPLFLGEDCYIETLAFMAHKKTIKL